MKNTYHCSLFALLLASCTTLWPVCASNEMVAYKETTLKNWQNQRKKEINKQSAFLSQQTVDGIALDKDTSSTVISFLFPTDSKPLSWDEFIARYKAGERFFDLCYIDLTEENKSQYPFKRHLLEQKGEEGYTFENVIFTKSFFKGDLANIAFKNCRFDQAIMNGIDAEFSSFYACSLENAELNRINFHQGSFMNSNCNQIQCIEGNMKGSRLINTSFEKSNLSAIYFYECQEFSELNFKNSCLVNAIINVGGIKNKNIDFTQADCSGATLYDITAENVIFDQTKLIKAKINSKHFLSLKNCLFKNCDFTQADLRIPTDSSCKSFWENRTISVEKDTFAGSWMEGSDLSQVVNLDMQTLAHAYLRDARLSKADSKRVPCLLKHYKNHRGIIDFSLLSGIFVVGNYFAYRHTE